MGSGLLLKPPVVPASAQAANIMDELSKQF